MEIKLEKQGWDALDVCRGGAVDVLTKDTEYGSARQEEKRKPAEKTPGCIVKLGIQRSMVGTG